MIKHILVIQFVLELQWILRLAFSPMQLDFESAPFSHLGTSPKTSLLYQRTAEKSRLFLIRRFLFCKFQDFPHFIADGHIVFTLMGTHALGTILNSCFCVLEAASAAITKAVKRTIAKQAAETFRISTLMTGKILAFCILKKIVMAHVKLLTSDRSSIAALLHRLLLLRFPVFRHYAEWFWQMPRSPGHKP